MQTKKFLLSEQDIPRAWYNVLADMALKPHPMIHPATHEPIKAEDLYPLFSKAASDQELNTTDAFIEIPLLHLCSHSKRTLYTFLRT